MRISLARSYYLKLDWRGDNLVLALFQVRRQAERSIHSRLRKTIHSTGQSNSFYSSTENCNSWWTALQRRTVDNGELLITANCWYQRTAAVLRTTALQRTGVEKNARVRYFWDWTIVWFCDLYAELFNVNYNLYLNCGSVMIIGSGEGHSEQLRNNIYRYIYIYVCVCVYLCVWVCVYWVYAYS